MNRRSLIKWIYICIYATYFFLFYVFFRDRLIDFNFIFFYIVFLVGSLGLFIIFGESKTKKKVKSSEEKLLILKNYISHIRAKYKQKEGSNC